MKHLNPLRILLLFFALANSSATIAHNGTVRGTVVNEATAHPLQAAVVTVEGTSKSVLTDALGRFSLVGLQEGPATVTVTHIGYATDTQYVVVSEMQPVELTFSLVRSGIRLAEVSVSAGNLTDVSRVNEIDFNLRPVRTTQDLLRNVPGLFIAQHAGGGKAEQIFLRGFDIDHGTDIRITVDGIPVNMVSHAHGQGYADLHWVIPETVESFRFGKGTYDAEQGDFATAGFVAFKTRDALESSLVKVEAGSFNTFRGVAMLKMPFKEDGTVRQTGYLAGEYAYSDGPFEAPQAFNRYNVLGKYSVFLNKDNLLSLSGSYFRSAWDASGQVPDRAVRAGLISRFGAIDATEGGETGRTNAAVQLTSQLRNGATFKNQIYWSRYDFSLYSNFTFFLDDSLNGDGIHQSEDRNIFGYNGAFTKETHIGEKALTTTLGAGIRYDRIDDIFLSRQRQREELGEYFARGDIRQANVFAWWNNTLQLAQRLTLNAALRYDHIGYTYDNALAAEDSAKTTASSARFQPKLNLFYTASRNVRLYLNTGIGFHSNDARVATVQAGREVMPPAYSADLGTALKLGKNALMNIALWGLKLDQEFVYVGDAGIVEPSGKTTRYGLDVSVRYQALSWLYADVDVNYTHARADGAPEGEAYIPLAPAFTSIGGLTAEFKNGIRAAARYRYIADRPANEDNSVVAKGYFVNDLSASHTWRRYSVGFFVENLFDVDWNEAQFDTESRLQAEPQPVSELHYTPGTPFNIRGFASVRF